MQQSHICDLVDVEDVILGSSEVNTLLELWGWSAFSAFFRKQCDA